MLFVGNWPLMLSFTDSLGYFLFKDTQTTETCWLDFESHVMLVRSVEVDDVK